ncbi:hypothetical protein GEMRC1_000858 [Eukaryota sp. GEM-RC1]
MFVLWLFKWSSIRLQVSVFILIVVSVLLGGGLVIYASRNHGFYAINLLNSATFSISTPDSHQVHIGSFGHYFDLTLFLCPFDVPTVVGPEPVTFRSFLPLGPLEYDSHGFALNSDSEVEISVGSARSLLIFSEFSAYREWKHDKQYHHSTSHCVNEECQPIFLFKIPKDGSYWFLFSIRSMFTTAFFFS